jgi:hypothetical protein
MQEVKKDTLALAKHFVSLPHPAKTTVMVFALCVFFVIVDADEPVQELLAERCK